MSQDSNERFIVPEEHQVEFSYKSLRWALKILYEKSKEYYPIADDIDAYVDNYSEEQLNQIMVPEEIIAFIKCHLPKHEKTFSCTYEEYENLVVALANEIVGKISNELVDRGIFDMVYDPKLEKITYKIKGE